MVAAHACGALQKAAIRDKCGDIVGQHRHSRLPWSALQTDAVNAKCGNCLSISGAMQQRQTNNWLAGRGIIPMPSSLASSGC